MGRTAARERAGSGVCKRRRASPKPHPPPQNNPITCCVVVDWCWGSWRVDGGGGGGVVSNQPQHTLFRRCSQGPTPKANPPRRVWGGGGGFVRGLLFTISPTHHHCFLSPPLPPF